MDLTAGYSYQNFDSESYYSTNTLLPAAEQKPDVVTSPGVNLQAYYSRLNVDLSEKYLRSYLSWEESNEIELYELFYKFESFFKLFLTFPLFN